MSKFKNITLFSGSGGVGTYSIPNVTDFDYLIIFASTGTNVAGKSTMLPVNNLVIGASNNIYEIGAYQSTSVYWELQFSFPTASSIRIDTVSSSAWSSPKITKIYGVKLK